MTEKDAPKRKSLTLILEEEALDAAKAALVGYGIHYQGVVNLLNRALAEAGPLTTMAALDALTGRDGR